MKAPGIDCDNGDNCDNCDNCDNYDADSQRRFASSKYCIFLSMSYGFSSRD
jgi:hypothetical protein